MSQNQGAPKGHHIEHIDDPWQAVQVVIDSGKESVERVCAGADLLHFGAKNFIPHNHPEGASKAAAPAEDHSGKGVDQLQEEIRTALGSQKKGAAAASAFPWQSVLPLVFALIQKLLDRMLS